MIIKLTPKKSESKVQDKTTIYQVDFRAKRLVSKTIVENSEISISKELNQSPECVRLELNNSAVSGE